METKHDITTGIIVFRKTREGIKFLILYHGHRYWNFPKGHIENEEQSLEAAFRETFEETGLRKEDLRLMRNFKTYERFPVRRGGQAMQKTVILYLAQTNNPIIKISKEHQGYGWFLYNDTKPLFSNHKDSQKVIQQAYEYLTRGKKKIEEPNLPAGALRNEPMHSPVLESSHEHRARPAHNHNHRPHGTNHHRKYNHARPYQTNRNIFPKSPEGGRFDPNRPRPDVQGGSAGGR